MTTPSDFNTGSAAPAPMDLELLEMGGTSESAAPAPAGLAHSSGGGAGEAPAPVDLDQLAGATGTAEPPEPLPLDQLGQATVDHIEAPSPLDGPGGDVAVVGAAQAGVPEPMTIDQLRELERGR